MTLTAGHKAMPVPESTAEKLARCCPVCASEKASEYLDKEDLRLVRCDACSMIYANPVPAALASGEYYDSEAAGYYLSSDKLASDYADVRFERELRIFRAHCPGGKVLDVGCSSGAFLYQLARRFPDSYEMLGTDASGPALDHAEKRGIAVIRGDFLKHDFGNRTFDAVTLWAVLEHLAAPAAVLEKARQILDERGLCFVLVPNMLSLASRVLGARYRYVYPQHLNYFTPATLELLVSKGFHIVDVRSTHFNPLVVWQDWRRAGAAVANEERATLLRKTTAYKQSRWLGPARSLYKIAEAALGAAGMADNLTMVLRKKVP